MSSHVSTPTHADLDVPCHRRASSETKASVKTSELAKPGSRDFYDDDNRH